MPHFSSFIFDLEIQHSLISLGISLLPVITFVFEDFLTLKEIKYSLISRMELGLRIIGVNNDNGYNVITVIVKTHWDPYTAVRR